MGASRLLSSIAGAPMFWYSGAISKVREAEAGATGRWVRRVGCEPSLAPEREGEGSRGREGGQEGEREGGQAGWWDGRGWELGWRASPLNGGRAMFSLKLELGAV